MRPEESSGVRRGEIRREDPGYPRRLERLPDPPARLFLRGALPDPWGPTVGIVGSREADLKARRHAAEIAAALAATGAIVVSGGARGVDTAAHEGAIAGRGRTVAVVGSGLDHLYPPSNRPLFERIAADGGAVVTELSPSTPPSRWTFPRRNRLIAALCDVVLVVQAPVGSGALITARIAGGLGVPVAAIPGDASDPRNRGSNGLIRAGAGLVEGAADVLALMNRAPLFLQLDLPEPPQRCKETPATAPTDLGEDEILVLDRLGPDPVHIDEIVAATGLGAARTQAALLTLELAGVAEDRGGKLFARSG